MNHKIFGFLLFIPGIFAFITQQQPGSITGRIVPYNAALHIWAVSDNDTAHSVIRNGIFEIKGLKTGRYRVIVEGLRPYKTTTRPDISVSNGVNKNVGDIILDQ